MAQLFDVGVPAISKHLKNIFESGELDEHSVISKMETTASDGKNYDTTFYNLDAIISVGYRVNSVRATQFRQWCTFVLRQFGNVRAVQHDAATIRCLNTGDAFQGIAFSASGSAQYAEYAARGFQIRAEVEIPQILFNVHGQAHLRTAFL